MWTRNLKNIATVVNIIKRKIETLQSLQLLWTLSKADSKPHKHYNYCENYKKETNWNIINIANVVNIIKSQHFLYI